MLEMMTRETGRSSQMEDSELKRALILVRLGGGAVSCLG